MLTKRSILIAAAALPLAAPALAQPTNVLNAQKYAWAENAGFLNCRDANGGAQGVVVHHTYLSGHIWGENIGWIRLGNGTDPTISTCFQYPAGAAQTNTTYGVNIGAGGRLSGYAWGEKIGWINFNTAHPSRPADQAARYDRAAKRFRGYAWGENIGWINLNDSVVYVGTSLCRADTDGNGLLQPADVSTFVNLWFCSLQQGQFAGDFDDNGVVEPADVSLFVSAWFNTLSGSC